MPPRHSPPAFKEMIARADYLSAPAQKLVPQAENGIGLLDLLEKEGLTEDAMRFGARWLSTRAAVWWGCLCLWHVARPQPEAKLEAALSAAVRWTTEPIESNRREAGRTGEIAGFGTAAGCLALAAFYSGGSMLDPKLPAIAPPPGLCAETMASAVLLASGGPPASADIHRQFIALARGVAGERLPWPSRSTDAPAPTKETQKIEVLSVPFTKPAPRPPEPDNLTGSIARDWDDEETPRKD